MLDAVQAARALAAPHAESHIMRGYGAAPGMSDKFLLQFRVRVGPLLLP